MNKKILYIGILVILIFIGLSGCISETSIKDINEHPNDYIDKEVTIQGFYGGNFPAAYSAKSIYQKNEGNNDVIAAKFNGEQVDVNGLILNAEYKFTGIVKSGEYTGVNYVYIEVIKFEAI